MKWRIAQQRIKRKEKETTLDCELGIGVVVEKDAEVVGEGVEGVEVVEEVVEEEVEVE
jgi:hypothetical protein